MFISEECQGHDVEACEEEYEEKLKMEKEIMKQEATKDEDKEEAAGVIFLTEPPEFTINEKINAIKFIIDKIKTSTAREHICCVYDDFCGETFDKMDFNLERFPEFNTMILTVGRTLNPGYTLGNAWPIGSFSTSAYSEFKILHLQKLLKELQQIKK